MIMSDSVSVGHLFARMGAPNCLSFLKSLSGGRRCQFWLPAWTRDRLEMRGWRLRYRTTWFMSSLTRSIDQSGTTNWRLGERAGSSFCAHSCTRAMSSA